MTTKRCVKCQLVKSASEFKKNRGNKDGREYSCKKCDQAKDAKRRQRGLEILQKLATILGHCQNCGRPYTNDEWHFFEFDHIDAKLKNHKYETSTGFVASNEAKFWETVVPNLQLLCVKCHKLKTTEENKHGGVVHQKKFGETKPPQVIDPGWNLFNPPPFLEDRETYSFLNREGDWVTLRDIDGNLVLCEPYDEYFRKK